MRLKIRLNTLALMDYSFPSIMYLEFDNISNLENWNDDDSEQISKLEIQTTSGTQKILYVFYSDDPSSVYDFDENDLDECAIGGYLTFDADLDATQINNLLYFINAGIVEVNQSGNTTIFLYKQNSENDALNKTLIFVDVLDGKFNNVVGLKKVTIDFYNYGFNCNYVYIPLLKRYYYIDSVDLISADFTRLHLSEDVLMSWKTLIKSQSALITRQENATLGKMFDERFPTENIKTIEYITPTPTGTGNMTNITLKGNFDATESNFLVSVNNDVNFGKSNVVAPYTALPNLSPIQSTYIDVYFLKLARINSLMKAIIDEDTLASSINAILFLPFVPTSAFNVSYTNPLLVGLPTSKVLCDDDKFHYLYDIPAGHVAWSDIGLTPYGTSPYLVLADFTFNYVSNWYDHSPNCDFEIYIAFVGWIKVNIEQIANKRLIIYYTIDFNTGNATAYLYNVSDSKIIYSCTCQLGVKLNMLSSNALELSRERQANELNTLIGLLASAVSIGAGVMSENPVAIAGGVLSAGKTIASAVNKERMMFERAQVTYGSGDAGLHSMLPVVIRKTYNKPILTTLGGINIYKGLQGYPYNKYESLSSLSGYTEIGDIHFNPMNYDIYQDEILEIVQLLKSGVIL